jgi:hypothetical protein
LALKIRNAKWKGHHKIDGAIVKTSTSMDFMGVKAMIRAISNPAISFEMNPLVQKLQEVPPERPEEVPAEPEPEGIPPERPEETPSQPPPELPPREAPWEVPQETPPELHMD